MIVAPRWAHRGLRALPRAWASISRAALGGFWYQNQLSIAQVFTEGILAAFDATQGTVDVACLEALAKDPRWKRWRPYSVFVGLLVPAIVPSGFRAAQEQTAIAQARLAVALERHRLARGSYPEALRSLVPEFLDRLPVDPVTGQLMVYRREAPNRYVLYAVGLNATDDGGAVAVTKTGAPAAKASLGDWVWPTAPVMNRLTIAEGAD
ncbi:MAG: hypothetical protein FJ387_23025 [Verrucomicrobia bacterium]|nr:hypothetical protein [Verrucomicrobiota bacterium]